MRSVSFCHLVFKDDRRGRVWRRGLLAGYAYLDRGDDDNRARALDGCQRNRRCRAVQKAQRVSGSVQTRAADSISNASS